MSSGVPQNTVINNRYRVLRKIGAGSFGEIYVGVSPTSDKVLARFPLFLRWALTAGHGVLIVGMVSRLR